MRILSKWEKSIAETREQFHCQEKMLLQNNLELKNKELTAKAVEMLHHVELLQSLSEKLKKYRHSDQCKETEIKIAALLRLNLCTKEIAVISYKSESAVKTTRHRLRQKLNLDHDNNLINFLMRI